MCLLGLQNRRASAKLNGTTTVTIVFDAQALLKNQKVALLIVLRGAFLGGIGTLFFNEFWYFFEDEGFILVILILQPIEKSSISTIFFIFLSNFWKKWGVKFYEVAY